MKVIAVCALLFAALHVAAAGDLTITENKGQWTWELKGGKSGNAALLSQSFGEKEACVKAATELLTFGGQTVHCEKWMNVKEKDLCRDVVGAVKEVLKGYANQPHDSDGVAVLKTTTATSATTQEADAGKTTAAVTKKVPLKTGQYSFQLKDHGSVVFEARPFRTASARDAALVTFLSRAGQPAFTRVARKADTADKYRLVVGRSPAQQEFPSAEEAKKAGSAVAEAAQAVIRGIAESKVQQTVNQAQKQEQQQVRPRVPAAAVQQQKQQLQAQVTKQQPQQQQQPAAQTAVKSEQTAAKAGQEPKQEARDESQDDSDDDDEEDNESDDTTSKQQQDKPATPAAVAPQSPSTSAHTVRALGASASTAVLSGALGQSAPSLVLVALVTVLAAAAAAL